MSDGPLIVQSDRTVLLEVAHPQAEDARHDLAVFAELERAPEHIHTYRITRLGLWNARAAGHQASDMLATLERLNWNKSRAAASLRWSRMTLYRKLAKYAINDPAPLVLEARAQPKPYRRDTVVTGDVTAA